MTRPLIIAHRGHSVGAPEQTLAAYRAASMLGADMIEVDVRRTKDGELVMMHDATVERTTSPTAGFREVREGGDGSATGDGRADGRGRVAALTFAELRRLDAGSWFSQAFAGERVPSLEEVFTLADEEDVALCLEVKGETLGESGSLAVEVARRIADRDRLERDCLASFDHAALATARSATPGLRTAPDRLPERGPSSGPTLVAQARRIGAEIIQHHHADLTGDVVAEVHAQGLAIWAWPTTAPEDIERALGLGVDGLMGDDVAAIAATVAAAYGERPPGRRRRSTP